MFNAYLPHAMTYGIQPLYQASVFTFPGQSGTNLPDSGELEGLDSPARQIYAQALGYTYPACVNRFYLLNRDATPFDDAVTYVHTFKHLEFICSTGFDVFQFNLNCIDNAQQASGTVYQACFYKFQQTVQKNPLRFCEASETFVLCVKDFFTQNCGAETGWVQCEKERIGFAYDCPGLSC
ncbi:unnamed protein product [Nippostrongylus brasiliensis]|uniref:Chitin-binding type-2 domain-containing protein n=1 Tax=Nippostrongylus brasiliensis TaxID=27835 RepID=A0A0N4XES4_NIPBR|nr:unnamed protein product [Nippostrongylus brasiliensis]